MSSSRILSAHEWHRAEQLKLNNVILGINKVRYALFRCNHIDIESIKLLTKELDKIHTTVMKLLTRLDPNLNYGCEEIYFGS